MKKLIKKSAFVRNNTTANSLKNRIELTGEEYNLPLLKSFEAQWNQMSDIRQNEKRNTRYVFGDQWGDLVKDEDGRYVTERSRLMKRTGGMALQNNHLFKVVNSIVGVYTKSQSMPVCFARQENADRKSQMMTNALQTNYDNNEMKDLLMSSMYKTILGGMPVLVEEWGSHEGQEDSYTYEVDTDYFVFRAKGTDPRMWDVDMVGEIRDYSSVGELCAKLSQELHNIDDKQNCEYDYKQLEAIYAPYINNENVDYIQQTDKLDSMSFKLPPTRNLCRAYHIWTLEYKPRYRCYDPMDNEQPVFRIEEEDLPIIVAENQARLEMGRAQGWSDEEVPLIEYKKIVDQYWHFQMLAPDGRILVEYDSPYEHGSHPYIFTAHHYIKGHIYPFIGVIIDQQRYINRLISLHDLAVQNSAKGIKMIPTNVLGGLSPQEFAKQWVEIGGFVFYTPDPKMPQVAPEVITTNATNIGTKELLQLEVDWINEISSVSGALQGAEAKNGTPASLYAMQMQNSVTSVSSLFARFNSFETQLARKKMKTIHQYYSEPRNISLKHSNDYAEFGMYEPKLVEDVDFSVSIKQNAETPVARMIINDLVKEMWQQGALTARQMLRFGYFEGADKIIQELDAQEEAMKEQQGQMPQGISPEQMQGIQANPDVVNQVKGALQQA